MSFGNLINSQVVIAIGDAFNLDIKINKLKDKIIDTIADKIEEQIPIPLPFNVRSILKDVARGNTPNIVSLASPAAMQQAISLLPPIPEGVKQPIRDTLDQIDDSLKPIIETKNAVINALDPLEKPIETLDKMTTTINSIIDPTKIVISALKAMPVPTAVGAPAVAVPIGVINTFGTIINTADVTLAKMGGPLSVIGTATSQIEGAINAIITPLKMIDGMMGQVTSITSFIRIYLGDPIVDGNGDNIPPNSEEYASSIIAAESKKISDISEDLPGPISSNSDPKVNKAANKALEASLQPGANPPYIYRGYKCIIQINPDPFSLPSRRIQGTFIKNAGNVYNVDEELQNKFNIDARLAEFLKGDIIYNIPSTDLILPGSSVSKPTNTLPSANVSANDTQFQFSNTSQSPNINGAGVEEIITTVTSSNTYSNDIRITGRNDHPYSFATSTQVLVREIQQQIDLRISGRVSKINRQNTRIVYDSAGVEVGIIPTLDSQILDVRDQKAIDYVVSLDGIIFSSYQELTTSRSFVYVNGNLLYNERFITQEGLAGGRTFEDVRVIQIPLKMVKAGQIPGEYGTVLDIDNQYLSFDGIVNYIENPSRMESYPPNVRSSGMVDDRFIDTYVPRGDRSAFEYPSSKLSTGTKKEYEAFNRKLYGERYNFPPFGSPGTNEEIRRYQPSIVPSIKSKTPTDNYSLWQFDTQFIPPSVLARFNNTFIPGIWSLIYENYPSGNNFEFSMPDTFPFDSPGTINGEYRVKLQGNSKNTYRWFDSKLKWILQSSVLV